jgi:hypothetical protein
MERNSMPGQQEVPPELRHRGCRLPRHIWRYSFKRLPYPEVHHQGPVRNEHRFASIPHEGHEQLRDVQARWKRVYFRCRSIAASVWSQWSTVLRFYAPEGPWNARSKVRNR